MERVTYPAALGAWFGGIYGAYLGVFELRKPYSTTSAAVHILRRGGKFGVCGAALFSVAAAANYGFNSVKVE